MYVCMYVCGCLFKKNRQESMKNYLKNFLLLMNKRTSS